MPASQPGTCHCTLADVQLLFVDPISATLGINEKILKITPMLLHLLGNNVTW